MQYLNPDKTRQVFFLVMLVLMAALLYSELHVFIPAFLGALTLYVLMRKSMLRLLVRKWRSGLAAGLLMLLSFVIIMVPIWALINVVSSRIGYLFDHSNELIETLKNAIKTVETKTGLDIVNENNLSKAGSMVASKVPNIVGATFETITTIAMMYFILFFMLTQGREMERNLSNFIPVSRLNLKTIAKEINGMVISNAIGIPLIAILQGVVAFGAYLFLGVKEPVLWFFITCITAMLPVIGAAFAYVPLTIILFAQGPTWKGVAMLIYGFGVIGTVDNIFRFWLQKKIADVHPLITIFGVIIGVSMFGFIGLIFGPLLISLFLLLIRIYQLEFGTRKPPLPDLTGQEDDVSGHAVNP